MQHKEKVVKMEKEKKKKAKVETDQILAKKNWIIKQNNFRFSIVEGKPLPKGIPDHLMIALKTEKVI